MFSTGQGVLVTLGCRKVLVATISFFFFWVDRQLDCSEQRRGQHCLPCPMSACDCVISLEWVWSSQVTFRDAEPSTDELTQPATKHHAAAHSLPTACRGVGENQKEVKHMN